MIGDQLLQVAYSLAEITQGQELEALCSGCYVAQKTHVPSQELKYQPEAILFMTSIRPCQGQYWELSVIEGVIVLLWGQLAAKLPPKMQSGVQTK